MHNAIVLHNALHNTIVTGADDPVDTARFRQPCNQEFVNVSLAVGKTYEFRLRPQGGGSLRLPQRLYPAIAFFLFQRRRHALPLDIWEHERASSARLQGTACAVPSGVPSGVNA